MDATNPLLQSVTLVTPSFPSPIAIPIPSIDAFNDESISISINYAFQIGACSILLLVLLIMTPPSKLLRPVSMLHIAGLITCTIRLSINLAFYLSPLNHFYQFWSGDYSSVPQHYFRNSVAGTVFSLLLVIVVEAALMHQAWTMVSLWPRHVRFFMAGLSGIISLLAIGWRFAFTVVASKMSLEAVSVRNMAWLVQSTLILNALSICWYCALFNTKLVLHLLVNRGILPPSGSILSPMEVLVMTNGILMVVPVIFAGLEFAKFPNFEAGSLTQSSVVIILPLGTLAAQQMTRNGSLAYISSGGHNSSSTYGNSSNTPRGNARNNATPNEFPSVSPSGDSSPLRQRGGVPSSPYEASDRRARRPDHFDIELQLIDSTSALADHPVRVDTDLGQNETRT
ncbi:pheromone alpha factor receptor [Conoideocrella luteorostrata]|uniref:Pheromone alpha factor receptor n=1 Tax=Conoideocrella luteorostrata TaxID=1105319 RepID=A0AAJ0CCM1_9HYPO|nr:pheromone alpha factor receptor [Conoideocrella luteorostrata]